MDIGEWWQLQWHAFFCQKILLVFYGVLEIIHLPISLLLKKYLIAYSGSIDFFFAKAIDYIDFISIQISLNDTINHEFKIRQHSGTKKKDNANSGPALEGFPCK